MLKKVSEITSSMVELLIVKLYGFEAPTVQFVVGSLEG